MAASASQITADNHIFDTVKEFIYLGSAITPKNENNMDGQLSNRDLSFTTKLILYKTLILLVLIYDAEPWTLLNANVAALRVFQRKVLRKLFGPVRVGGDFRIRFNSELYELLYDMDVVQRIYIQ